MHLRRTFRGVRFPESVIRKAISVVDSMPRGEEAASYTELQVSLGDEFWRFDKVEDFFAKFPSAEEGAISYDFPLSSPYWRCIMLYTWSSLGSTVSVNSEHAHQINTVMNVFNGSLELAFDSHKGDMSSEADVNPEFNIFIGHGRSKDWEELRNHLQDKHHYKVISFETGARAGHQIRDILDEMLDRSSLAFLILTGEDETEDHKIRARQNVIHELGLFQGRLGFSKAISFVWLPNHKRRCTCRRSWRIRERWSLSARLQRTCA
jgi:hypothetical protein